MANKPTSSSSSQALVSKPVRYKVAKQCLPYKTAYGEAKRSHRATDSETGRLWAVDYVRGDSGYDGQLSSLISDVEVASELHHKNLLQYVGSDTVEEEGGEFVVIFSELCSAGSLSRLTESMVDMNGNSEPLSLMVVGSFLLQICSGLSYLHSKGHFHGGALGVCVDNVYLCRGNTLKLANYYPLSSRDTSINDLIRLQAKDVRDLGNLTGHLLTMDSNNLDLPAAARSFVQECNKEGASAKVLLQHPFLRAAMNASGGSSTAVHSVTSTPERKVRRGSFSSVRSRSSCRSSNNSSPTFAEGSSSALPNLNSNTSIASGGSTPTMTNRKTVNSSNNVVAAGGGGGAVRRSNAWESLEDFESFGGGGSSLAPQEVSLGAQAAGNTAAVNSYDCGNPRGSAGKKLTIAQQAFLKNAGGARKPPSGDEIVTCASYSSESEIESESEHSNFKQSKLRDYDLMRQRREMSHFIDNLTSSTDK